MKPIIAADADGVLLDYHHAYRNAWAKVFGVLPALRDPQAYWATDRWEVRRLEGAELAQFRECFDHQYWSSIPAIPGGAATCVLLVHFAGEKCCGTVGNS